MKKRVVIVGGGAAGFFTAIACAEAAPQAEVVILEKTSQLLQKVRISGGGRCNVTHACFDPDELTKSYPRGQKELIGPYHRFQAEDTVRWFETRGVRLKTEADGRMFPTTDSSETIVNCLLKAARQAGIGIKTNVAVNAASRASDGYSLQLSNGETISCVRLVLATGGCRTAALGQLAVSLGHTLQPPVPSLFTFHIEADWLRKLAGVSIPNASVSVAGTKLQAAGALLFTHWGLSGPAILRLSAWGARILHDLAYNFPLVINWVPERRAETLGEDFMAHARSQGAKLVMNAAPFFLPGRFWEAFAVLAGIPRDKRWSALARAEQQRLVAMLVGTELRVTGKSLNKDEFVTCGGVPLDEINFRTMESKRSPGLYLAGELLDIDGITGGFNFQAAWTTGWIAGKSIATSFD